MIRFASTLAMIACTSFLFSCNLPNSYENREIHRRVATPTSTSGPLEGRATLGAPIAVPASPWVLIPFALEREQEAFEKNASYGASYSRRFYHQQRHESHMNRGWFYPTPKHVVWHNAIFSNIEAGNTRVLLSERTPIVGYWLPRLHEPMSDNKQEQRVVTPPFVLFEIVTEDTNGDGHLTPRDATRAFVANPDGASLRALTPVGKHVAGRSHLNRATPTVFGACSVAPSMRRH